MLLIALGYLLLAMRITVGAEAAVCGMRGSACVEVGALGVSFRLEREIDAKAEIGRFFGGMHSGGEGKKRLKNALRMLHTGRFESAFVQMRIGAGDAAKTAVAAGAVRAALLAAAAGMNIPVSIGVEPDFDMPCFLLAARGIYSFRIGDIMFAAAAAGIQKRKEGFCWKNIPLRA